MLTARCWCSAVGDGISSCYHGAVGMGNSFSFGSEHVLVLFIEDDNCGLHTAEGLLVGLYTVLKVPGEGSFWSRLPAWPACIPIHYLEGGVVLGCFTQSFRRLYQVVQLMKDSCKVQKSIHSQGRLIRVIIILNNFITLETRGNYSLGKYKFESQSVVDFFQVFVIFIYEKEVYARANVVLLFTRELKTNDPLLTAFSNGMFSSSLSCKQYI